MFRKWKKIEQAECLIRISHCLDKGYTLSEAVRLQSFEQHPRIKKTINHLLQSLEGGLPISEVFLKAGFPKECCSFLYYAMYTGELASGFMESGRYLKLKEQQKDKLNKLFRYPLFLLWMFVVMFFIMLNQLLPSFEQLYRSMSIDLPNSVQLLLAIPDHLGAFLASLTVIIGITIILIIFYLKSFNPLQRCIHLSRIPYLSSFIKMYLSYYFSFHLGGLLRVGLPLSKALDLIERQDFLTFFKLEARSIKENLVNGLKLPDILRLRNYYTHDLAMVIQNGEVQGRVGDTLQEYSQILFIRLEEKMTRAFSAIQPICFIIFGCLIIMLFLSILTPMFTVIKGL
ncbi:MAG: competence type IV pilus assembly protein ComGB [Tuberibacillus sp.]